jgi:outer membrane lipoprotein-sorting protein
MRVIFVIIVFIFPALSEAKNLKCSFEEVYQNGEVQKGKLFLQNELFRYEYLDPQLYTIIYNQNFFIIRNDNHIVNQLQDDELLTELKNILSNFSSLKDEYQNGDYNVKIEKSIGTAFLKRISLKSQKANLSIFFYNCENNVLSPLYFQPFFFKQIP